MLNWAQLHAEAGRARVSHACLTAVDSAVPVQADLRVEEAHLKRFARNFAPIRAAVAPPLPLPGMATEAVLVETFEPGAELCTHVCWHFIAV